MDRTEQLIVERLKENDDKAWHYLFDRHYPVLCHIASRYVHDDFLAETIVGDVILHLQHWVSTKCPFAGRGPCGHPHPGWEIGYPAMADGHKGRALQEDRNVRLIIKGSTGYQQNGHLQGAALVAVRTQDGKLVTLQRRTCLSVICSSVVGLLRWKEYIKKHKKFLIFLINKLYFTSLRKIRNNDRTIEYII